MWYSDNKKRVLAVVNGQPQMAVDIYWKIGHIKGLPRILKELEAEGEIKSKVWKLAKRPYSKLRLWFLADASKLKFPVFENKKHDIVFAAIKHEPQTQTQIREQTWVENVHNYLFRLEQLGLIKCNRPHKRSFVWYLPKEENDAKT